MPNKSEGRKWTAKKLGKKKFDPDAYTYSRTDFETSKQIESIEINLEVNRYVSRRTCHA